jgi:hypothetical protein
VFGKIIVSMVPSRQIKCRLSPVRTISFVRLRPLTTFNRPEATVDSQAMALRKSLWRVELKIDGEESFRGFDFSKLR